MSEAEVAAHRQVILFYADEVRLMAGRAARFSDQLAQYGHEDVAEQLRMAGLALDSIADQLAGDGNA